MSMSTLDALAIVIDLANENVLEEGYCDDVVLLEEKSMQEEAVSKVGELLEFLRGNQDETTA